MKNFDAKLQETSEFLLTLTADEIFDLFDKMVDVDYIESSRFYFDFVEAVKKYDERDERNINSNRGN